MCFNYGPTRPVNTKLFVAKSWSFVENRYFEVAFTDPDPFESGDYESQVIFTNVA